MKYFIFSIDDGTIYDREVIAIFNRYQISATFNLNSGLQDFVWYKDNKPVRRLSLYENTSLYDGHEIASHSCTHPYMTMCPEDIAYQEVEQDVEDLSLLFHKDITTFAFPFEDFDERTISIVRRIPSISVIRISELDTSYKFPKDLFHVKITSWDIDDALNKVEEFIKDKNAELFVFVAHSYDFEFDQTYDKLEKLCQIVTKEKDIKIITMNELTKIIH